MSNLVSFNKNKKGISLMLISAMCVCFGQLFWKLSSDGLLFMVWGFFLYGLGAIIMIIAYKHGSLSVLQPVLSVNYIISLFLGYKILGEAITVYKIIGTFLIITGMCFICSGDD